MMKRVVLASCFDWYELRLRYIKQYFESYGYEVTVYISDFYHLSKKKRIADMPGMQYLHVPTYKRNLSIVRIFSHIVFAYKLRKELYKLPSNIIYALVPPNAVAYVCGRYKRRHPSTKLIFDVIDLWPESFTRRRILQSPFKVWANLRDKSLKYADQVFTECALYQDFLNIKDVTNITTLHLCRDSADFLSVPRWDGKSIYIAYLGSINNIIDIQLIERLVREIGVFFAVTVRVIGIGEHAGKFKAALQRTGASVYYYGAVFDKTRIKEIFSDCHFAINMMKPCVCVGLTIKSMDYLQMGLPILNTIKGDTEGLVEKFRCGYNVKEPAEVASDIVKLTEDGYYSMRCATQAVFRECFITEKFVDTFHKSLLFVEKSSATI